MTRFFPDSEEPSSLSDIRDLFEFCSNTRLRIYVLLLVSSGIRATEAASLRMLDIDMTDGSPTRIIVTTEYSKIRRCRTVCCSDEATKHLQKLLQWKYRSGCKWDQQDLIFAIHKRTVSPKSIYNKMLEQFERLHKRADKEQRKENSQRHKITLHSFRRTAFSIINEQTNSEYANWFLDHNHSVYWSFYLAFHVIFWN
jgi:integrase